MDKTPIIVISSIFFTLCIFLGLHKIDEGHVGVYYRGGKVLDGYNEPGYHVQIPFLTSHD